jgi:hypothetical protein
MKTNWLRIACFTQVLLAVYFQLIQWVPLGKWNYQPGFDPLAIQAARGHLEVQDVVYVALFALPVLLFWLARRKRWAWMMWLCLIGYISWLVMQIQTWWIVYVFGASDRWMAIYQRVFGQSIKILPSFGRHLAPDGMHLVLQMLLASVVVSTFLGLLQRRRTPTRERK